MIIKFKNRLFKKIGEGHHAELFRYKSEKILKLFKRPEDGDVLKKEITALSFLNHFNLPVPRIYDVVETNGRQGYTMECIEGDSIYNYILKKPWMFLIMAKKFGEAQARIHDVTMQQLFSCEGIKEFFKRGEYKRETYSFFLSTVKKDLNRRIKKFEYLPVYLKDYVLDILKELPNGDCLCHSDYTIVNVLVKKKDLVIIDWALVRRGDPIADVLHTILQLKYATVPPELPFIVRNLIKMSRNIFIFVYLKAYKKNKKINHELFKKWKVVCTAEYLINNYPRYEEVLRKKLEKNYRKHKKSLLKLHL